MPTDRQTAFQLYIVDSYLYYMHVETGLSQVPALLAACVGKNA